MAAIAPKNCVVHSLRNIAALFLDDVRGVVERAVYARVTREFLDVLWVLAYHEEYCSACVSGVVLGGSVRLRSSRVA